MCGWKEVMDVDECGGLSSPFRQSSLAMRPLRLAVFDCEDLPKWADMTLPLVEGILRRRPDDVFEAFHVTKNEFPPLEDVMKGELQLWTSHAGQPLVW